eukprot:768624-Hanusia_phi.AAC.6
MTSCSPSTVTASAVIYVADIPEDAKDRDNVVIPTLKTLHLLLSNAFLDHLDPDASDLPRRVNDLDCIVLLSLTAAPGGHPRPAQRMQGRGEARGRHLSSSFAAPVARRTELKSRTTASTKRADTEDIGYMALVRDMHY